MQDKLERLVLQARAVLDREGGRQEARLRLSWKTVRACHEQVFDWEGRRCIFLDVDAILVRVAEKDIRHVPALVIRLDADRRGMYARLNHIGIDHAHDLLTHLVGRHINVALGIPTQHTCHKLAVERAALGPAACILVLRLQLSGKDRLLATQEKTVRMPLACHKTGERRIRVRWVRYLQIRVDHADDAHATLCSERCNPSLVVPGQAQLDAIDLARLRRLVDRFDDRLDAHRHFFIWLIVA